MLDNSYKNTQNVWVIGNGESRLAFDLSIISDHTIGCNAVCRDYKCDEYVAVDRRVVSEISSLTDHPVYTRAEWFDTYRHLSNLKIVPNLPFTGPKRADEPFQWTTGPYAILIAALYKPKTVYLLGFDLWSKDNKINNVYKGTKNYNDTNYRAVDPSYWIHQMARLFEHFSNINFVQLQHTDWQCPPSWMAFKNLTIKHIPV